MSGTASRADLRPADGDPRRRRVRRVRPRAPVGGAPPSGSAGASAGGWTVTVRSSAPRTSVSSSGAEPAERLEQAVGVVTAAAGRHDAGPLRRFRPPRLAAVLDAADEDAVPLGQADGSAQPARDVRRRDRDAQPDARRLAAGQGVDRAQARIGGQRKVEALADAVRVEADEPARRRRRRRRPTTGRERGRVLDAARDPATAGPAEARDTDETRPERDPRPPPERAAAPNTASRRRAPCRRPRERRAPAVSTSRTARSPSASTAVTLPQVGGRRRSDRDLVAAEVVGVGQDAAVGDDDAGAARRRADPDDGRAGRRW